MTNFYKTRAIDIMERTGCSWEEAQERLAELADLKRQEMKDRKLEEDEQAEAPEPN